jgi:magnesium-transporting ATPase (P-type)
MQRQQSEYASQSSPYERFAQENQPRHTQKKRQKRILAGVSLGLWALVSFFVFWNNSEGLNTFTNSSGIGAFYMQSEHFLLISGFVIFTCLLLFVNFLFRHRPSTTRSTTDNAGKIHDNPVRYQLIQSYKHLCITISSLLLWIGIFITSVWQLSNHPLAFVHHMMYRPSPLPSVFDRFPDRAVDAWIILFMVVSYLLFFLNKRLYSRARKKAYE